ncbi:mitochondrial ribosomal small subunit component [Orbilia ellipsospora]|uniref:37S ribosomal protein S25, mitochondrial n=1 Tax=Orbilia ellipsospora TaxID=2528407 RepID=A0AAV9X924_9PEZI
MALPRGAKPLRIYKETVQLLNSGIIQKEPPWYRVVAAVPPSTVLVRTAPVKFDPVQKEGHQQAKISKKSKRFFRPEHIRYVEDDLRKTFFADHPWELARPRILVENDGRDGLRYDWSKLQQLGKPLDGESVIQRQMWLMGENESLSKKSAYDIARKEFYKIRMRSDIERRIAAEEARSVGAYFGKSHIQVGLELEEHTLATWRTKAESAVARKQQKMEALTGPGGAEDDSVDEDATTESGDTVEMRTPPGAT